MSDPQYAKALRSFLEAVARTGELKRRQASEPPTFTTPKYRLSKEQQAEFVGELTTGSERSAAILAAAHLDSQLEDLLKGFMVEDSKPVTALFSTSQPLGPFGTRITLAFGLGLITEDEYHDLVLIKKIRNDFAHEMYQLSFTDQSIRDRTNQLRHSTDERYELFHDNPRMSFVICVARLINLIGHHVDAVPNVRRVALEPVSMDST